MKIDRKDRRILAVLDRNSRLSCAEIGRRVGVSQEVAYKRIANLHERGIVKWFQTVVAVESLGYMAPKLYLQLENVDTDRKNEMMKYLKENKSVFWIGVCQGRWDLIVAYWCKDINHFGDQLDEFLTLFHEDLVDREVTVGRSSAMYSRRWFLDSSERTVEMGFGGRADRVQIDEIDFSLLRNLACDARISSVDLARSLKLKPSLVRHRIKQLERKNVIRGYKIALDSQKLGYETCKAFIRLKNASKSSRMAFLEYCKEHPNIINVVFCVGSWDVEIELEVSKFDEFYDIMEKTRSSFPEMMGSYESVLFKNEPKQVFMPEQ